MINIIDVARKSYYKIMAVYHKERLKILENEKWNDEFKEKTISSLENSLLHYFETK